MGIKELLTTCVISLLITSILVFLIKSVDKYILHSEKEIQTWETILIIMGGSTALFIPLLFIRFTHNIGL